MPSNSRGQPPASYPSANPYSYPRTQQTQLRPRLEWDLSNPAPYVQQNVILTLRIVSSSNIQSVDPVLPQDQALMFHKLKGPTAYSRVTAGGQRQIVNEIIYMVTPVRDGEASMTLGVTVDTGDNAYGSNTLTLNAAKPLSLKIKPVQAGVVPWLPLEQLALTSNLGAPVEVEPGKPVTLVLKLSAAGATGSQLPSLERMLQSPDFRVYRERTETEGGLSQNGRHIMGTRTEHYTLVPQYGGQLRLPSARLSWFNVHTNTVEHTTLPIKTLKASGTSGGLDRFFGDSGDSLFPAGYTSAFWLPLGGVFLLLTGYWVGVWYKGRKASEGNAPLAPLRRLAATAASGVRSRSRRTVARLNPVPYWNRTVLQISNMLPTSVRFWFWVRCANDERDPGLWCKTLQFLSCRQLALSPYAPLPAVAEKIIQFQSRSDPEQVRELFRELDGAIYGNATIDFEQWKRRFQKQVRPSLFARRWSRDAEAGTDPHKLPELNPKAA
jgi:hypothetical protein